MKTLKILILAWLEGVAFAFLSIIGASIAMAAALLLLGVIIETFHYFSPS